MVGRVALVTGEQARGLDTDEPLLIAALDALDIGVEVLDWDRPADWSECELAVIRSTWDYAARVAEFLAWAAETAKLTHLHNPVSMLTWNTDKAYLSQLSESGLPVIETTFITAGAEWAVAELSQPIVLKPSVSAGGQDTARYGVEQLTAAREHMARLHARGRTVMVQPYLEAVEDRDETALVYIGATFSHAAAKGALLRAGSAERGLFAPETIMTRTPSDDELQLGAATMDWLARSGFGTPLYARVDLLPGEDGRPVILEVELTEPSLFLETDAGAADRMAAAIRGLLDG